MTREHLLSMNESDMYGHVKPSELLRICMECSMVVTAAEGGSEAVMRDRLGGVWMLARLRLRQYFPLESVGTLTLSAPPRSIMGGGYLRCIYAEKDGVRAADCDMIFMVVGLTERKIIRPREIEPCWNTPPAEVPVTQLPRLRFTGEGQHVLDMPVRGYDCDANGHLTSHRYVDYACEAGGFWGHGPRMARELQVEFMSECPYGETLSIERAEDGDRVLLRGAKSDGRVGFCASCLWE